MNGWGSSGEPVTAAENRVPVEDPPQPHQGAVAGGPVIHDVNPVQFVDVEEDVMPAGPDHRRGRRRNRIPW